MTDRINEIIEDAIAILNDDTWCKGEERVPHFAYGTEDTTYRYCAIGALKEAVGFNWVTGEFESEEDGFAWRDAVRRCDAAAAANTTYKCGCGCGEASGTSIVAYNDGPAESAEDVKLMMKRAIET